MKLFVGCSEKFAGVYGQGGAVTIVTRLHSPAAFVRQIIDYIFMTSCLFLFLIWIEISWAIIQYTVNG